MIAARFQKLLTSIGEIVEVTEIGLAFKNGQLTAEQASEAVSQIGASRPGPGDDRVLVDA